MPNWEEIQRVYETTELSYTELEERFGVKVSTLKSRKKRGNWQRTQPADATGADSTNRTQPDAAITEVRGQSVLTEKQQLFCRYYIKTYNATMAAKRAGYAADSAHVTGSQLIRNPKIRGEIQKLKGEVQKDLMVGPMDIVSIQLKIAFADVTEYVKFGKREETIIDEYTGEPLRYKNGKTKKRSYNYVEFEDWDKVDGTIISEVKQGKDGVSVKLSDRSKALDFLTKYFDMVPDEYKEKLLELKVEELALRKAEVERSSGAPEEPDISKYIAALRGQVKDVFADEQD